ncbi:MAG TPA: hypothetical protein DD670_10140 [Planctomycetaceae bacterium]|nr:hypothetical protein [Planctomycetaceae bacterium]
METRGHVLVVMLAYQIVMELRRCWQDLNVTVAEGVSELSGLCMTEVTVKGQATINQVPVPRRSIQRLLQAAQVRLPHVLPCRGTKVYTKKKLPEERKNR